MFTQEDTDDGREQLPPTRTETGDKRATKGKTETMSTSGDVWFFLASHMSLCRFFLAFITSDKIT